jgi:acetyl esterase/lipase
VHVPAFDLPASSYLSAEALAFQQSRASMPQFNGGAAVSAGAPTIVQMRAGVERQLAPNVAAQQARYAVDITEQTIAGVPTRVFAPRAGEADRRRVLINLHGGGFSLCAYGCAMVESIPIAAVGRFKVISVDYRQGPEHRFPAASEDVATVYRELLRTYRPENIGIYGCSAGGSLSAQVASWFQSHDLPNPGVIGIFGAGGTRMGSGDSAYVTAYIDGSFPAPRSDGAGAAIGYF